MPDNKLVIRRLPPSMSEDEFLKQVSPLPDHDYLCFFEANSGLGPHSFARAYINFLDSNDMSIFRERFDNYVFLDKDGHEYPAVVEQSLWHKSAKNGPFYKKKQNASDENAIASCSSCDATTNNLSKQPKGSPIEEDPDYLKFIELLQAPKKRPQNSPTQTLEANLDELTKQQQQQQQQQQIISGATRDEKTSNKETNLKVITPLIDFVNQQRSFKGGSGRRERGK